MITRNGCSRYTCSIKLYSFTVARLCELNTLLHAIGSNIGASDHEAVLYMLPPSRRETALTSKGSLRLESGQVDLWLISLRDMRGDQIADYLQLLSEAE